LFLKTNQVEKTDVKTKEPPKKSVGNGLHRTKISSRKSKRGDIKGGRVGRRTAYTRGRKLKAGKETQNVGRAYR